MTTSLGLYSKDIEKVHILYALDLPGCYSEGATEAEALGNFPAAFGSSCDWLTVHGEAVPDLSGSFEIAGRFASYTLADGYEVNGLFEPERQPPDREFVAGCCRLLGYSRLDLLAAAKAIPTAQRDLAFTAGERTPRQVIEHVARAEWWYLSHFADVPAALHTDHPPGSPTQFEAVQAALINWLTNIPREQLGTVAVDREEEWSVRKLLRRALWHERTHTAELACFARD
ncbi:MAG: DinB family protein [Thermomicrobiales bacterium]